MDNNTKGNVVIIGAGRSGRGYLGELCFLDGYRLSFADVKRELIKKMRERKRYISFRDNGNGGFDEYVVEGFDAFHTVDHRQDYLKALAEADIIFTATFDDAFDAIVEDICESVRLRMSLKLEKQFVLVLGANYIGLYDYFSQAFKRKMSGEEHSYFEQYAVMVESIIYRVSSFPTDEQKEKDELSIQSDNFNVLQVNTAQVAQANQVATPNFFGNEDDTLRFMHCKIWNINTSHCSLAYLGQYYGYENVCDAANDDLISRMAYCASEESYAGLARRYNLPPQPEKTANQFLWNWYRDLTMKDTVIRVGNDPLRKLRRNDRFIGAALNALEYGITPVHICQNAAYGFYFHNDGDPSSEQLHKMIREQGIEKTVRSVCGLEPEKDDKDKLVYDLIIAKYYDLAPENPVDNYLK